jgi:hypothetical protein
MVSRFRKQENVDFALCWLREVDVLGFLKCDEQRLMLL